MGCNPGKDENSRTNEIHKCPIEAPIKQVI